MRVVTLALLLATISCADSARGSGPTTGSEAGTNLLLVTLDTVRADRVGAYGYDEARTPALDGLAARGVLFEQAYSTSPMTLPAHSTMLTGLLPPQHGARVNGLHRLEGSHVTLAELLAERGFETAAFVAAFVLDSRFGLDQGFEAYDDDLTEAYENDLVQGLARYRSGDKVVDRALDWFAERDRNRPFFAWVHLYDAHFPWYDHSGTPGAEGSYDDEVAFVDAQLARLLSALEEEGTLDRTLVAALADHGEGLGDHGEIEHAFLLNEEAVRIPWILAGPGVPHGRRVPKLVSLEDLLPTLGELLGVGVPRVRGRSLVPTFGGGALDDVALYAETDLPWTSFRWAPQRSLTTDQWRYIRSPRAELYDRESDSRELSNLAVARPDVLRELEAQLAELEREVGQVRSGVAELTAVELEQLAALGYVAGGADAPPEDSSDLADVKDRLHLKQLSTRLRQGMERGDLAPARQVELAQRLVAESPETPLFHHELGQALVEFGDYEAALPHFERAVEMAPEDASMHYALGDALQQLGRHEEARVHVELALEREPKMAAAHVCMGNILRDEGHPDLAAGSYTEAIRLRGEYPEAHYNLAMTLLDRGRPEEALEEFRVALVEKPGWTVAEAMRARVLAQLGRLDEALDGYRQVEEERLGDPRFHDELGVVLHRRGLPEEAVAHFLAAAELAPGWFQPHLNRANLAFDYGNFEIAAAEYEQALALAPGELETTLRLARFLALVPTDELRDPARAVALAESVVGATGGRAAEAFLVLGLACASAEQFPKAIAAAKRGQELARAEGAEGLVELLERQIEGYVQGERPMVTLLPNAPTDGDGARAEPGYEGR